MGEPAVPLFRGVTQPSGASRHFLRSRPLKLITKNSRTVGGPLPPVGPPVTTQQPPHRYATAFVLFLTCSKREHFMIADAGFHRTDVVDDFQSYKALNITNYAVSILPLNSAILLRLISAVTLKRHYFNLLLIC